MNKNELSKIIKESLINYFFESKQTQIQKYGEELVNRLLPLDPSKTYKYIEQICNYYKEGISEKEIKEYIDLYDEKLNKNLISKEYNDINNIKTFKDLKDIINTKSQEISRSSFENNLMKETYINTIINNEGVWDVYRPYNTLQQIKLGKNTKWCISSIEARNYFNEYFIDDDVRFYIFINRDTTEKFQLNIYPNNKKEVWDKLDINIGCINFKELADIDCKDYSWYPMNEYIKDIIAYDKLGKILGHIINNKKEGEWITYDKHENIQFKQNYKNGIPTNNIIIYDENGKELPPLKTINGKKEGTEVTLGLDGYLKSTISYKNGMKNGKAIRYYDNGSIYEIEYYKDNKLNGEYIEYYGSGRIHIKKHYKDNEFDGEYIIYYTNGNTASITHYKDGEYDGEYITYYENGKINVKKNYKNGKLDGEEINYYEDGKIDTIIHNENGLLDGEYIHYFNNGKIESKMFYKNDVLEGEQITYYENGNIKVKQHYKNNKLDGEFIRYHENGNIELKKHYKDGEKDGEFIEFNDKNPILKTYYKNGELDGEYIEYDEKGNIISKSYFKDGIKVNNYEQK